MSLIDRLSISQLHDLLNIGSAEIAVVNSLVRKLRNNDYFDLVSNKQMLRDISKIVVTPLC